MIMMLLLMVVMIIIMINIHKKSLFTSEEKQ